MSNSEGDIIFTGSIPKLYETYLVPLIFAPYAEEMVKLVAPHSPSRLLEIAAGIGS